MAPGSVGFKSRFRVLRERTDLAGSVSPRPPSVARSPAPSGSTSSIHLEAALTVRPRGCAQEDLAPSTTARFEFSSAGRFRPFKFASSKLQAGAQSSSLAGVLRADEKAPPTKDEWRGSAVLLGHP